MASILSDSIRRRLEQWNPERLKERDEQNTLYRTQPMPGQTYGSDSPTYRAQPIPGQMYATGGTPGDYGINYSKNQTGTNGQQTSPVVSGSQLPKYENVDQFDFNRNYEDTLDTLQRQRADAQQQYDLSKQRVNEDYDRQFRDVRRAQQEAIALENERMAGQGILRSGLATRAAGDVGSKYGSELDALQRQLSTQIEGLEGSYANTERGIQEQIGRAQEYLTRQQQMLEEQRARQAAAAAAAQRAAEEAARTAVEKKPQINVVKDNLGKYFIVDPTRMTRQQVDAGNLGQLNDMYKVNQYDSLQGASSLFGGTNYINNANALARRLGGNLGGQASLDVRLGFQDLGKWG